MEEAGAEVPLLKGEGEYHPGCPGCAHDRKRELYRGLPHKEFLYLWLICLTAALPISSLFPFLYFMAYAIEVCRPEHEALALSLVSTAWGIGLIIGPAIGGYLSQETLHKHKAGANEYQTVEALESHLIDPKEKANQNESDRKYGGLSLSSEDVGQVLAITGSRGHKNASMLPSFQMVILEPCTRL
ncbi:hypothetical protein E2562_021068 [Oryza meyeriana var. granulata]|uniref:Major facilitator superfamily (MFS) profile domain-containing protein n=1 Tax=Oryza meyeriana var. granulata TaxID=110450 RepID=A0A6G1BM62_9ORYZ|nr:hypothetical protein E2562_021068 [Oryza meyeriana var. granulata]